MGYSLQFIQYILIIPIRIRRHRRESAHVLIAANLVHGIKCDNGPNFVYFYESASHNKKN